MPSREEALNALHSRPPPRNCNIYSASSFFSLELEVLIYMLNTSIE